MYPFFAVSGNPVRRYYCLNGHDLITWHADGGDICFTCRQPGQPGFPPEPATRSTDVKYRTHYWDIYKESLTHE